MAPSGPPRAAGHPRPPGARTGARVSPDRANGANGDLPHAADLPTMSMAVRPASADDDLVTIGVVIDIPEPFGHELQSWRREFGDELAESIPAHVTLLPPTEVPPGSSAQIRTHLEDVAARTQPFAVRLRGTDSFRPITPVVFVVIEEGAAGCDQLQQDIRSGPLHRELAFPFHPHVTVAHHLDEASLDRAQSTLLDYEADFTISSVGLYEHGRDGLWRLRRRFEFGR